MGYHGIFSFMLYITPTSLFTLYLNQSANLSSIKKQKWFDAECYAARKNGHYSQKYFFLAIKGTRIDTILLTKSQL